MTIKMTITITMTMTVMMITVTVMMMKITIMITCDDYHCSCGHDDYHDDYDDDDSGDDDSYDGDDNDSEDYNDDDSDNGDADADDVFVVQRPEHVRITDFGLAKLLNNKEAMLSTTAEKVLPPVCFLCDRCTDSIS